MSHSNAPKAPVELSDLELDAVAGGQRRVFVNTDTPRGQPNAPEEEIQINADPIVEIRVIPPVGGWIVV
jgi:hypothetical protein